MLSLRLSIEGQILEYTRQSCIESRDATCSFGKLSGDSEILSKVTIIYANIWAARFIHLGSFPVVELNPSRVNRMVQVRVWKVGSRFTGEDTLDSKEPFVFISICSASTVENAL